MGEDVSPEARALAEELRAIWLSLGISVRRYAARCHTDAGTVSRYLRGRRLPPWSFVQGLLTQVAEHRGEPVTKETIEHLHRLYRTAISSGGANRRVAELLSQLEEKDQEAREFYALVQATTEALQNRQHQLRKLQTELRALEVARAADRDEQQATLDRARQEHYQLRAERDRLYEEVTLLRHQLARAKQTATLAEERCAELERRLDSAEEDELRAEREQTAHEPGAAATEQVTALQSELERLFPAQHEIGTDPDTPDAKSDDTTATHGHPANAGEESRQPGRAESHQGDSKRQNGRRDPSTTDTEKTTRAVGGTESYGPHEKTAVHATHTAAPASPRTTNDRSEPILPEIALKVLRGIAVAVGIAAVATAIVRIISSMPEVGDGWDPRYKSGDKPQSEWQTLVGSCNQAGCSTAQDLVSHEWRLHPSSRPDITTTLVVRKASSEPDPTRLVGNLKHQIDDCPGAVVKWTIRVNGSVVATGTALDTNLRKYKAFAASQEVTISARRTDPHPCATVLRWDQPGLDN